MLLRRIGPTLVPLAVAATLVGCGSKAANPGALSSHAKPATSAGGAAAPGRQVSSSSAAGPLLAWKSHHPSAILPGDVLIADSENNRILLVTPGKRIVWQFPVPGVKPNQPFSRPDDSFFGPHYDEIITNEEDFNTISIINFKTRKVVWQYGHYGQAGSAPGYLNTPDDAFLYDRGGGLVTVADIRNQRLLFINRQSKAIIKQYGQTGVMAINPPTQWSAPNGDFPAPNQGMLVTQINGDDAVLLNRQGQVVWTVHFPYPLSYPSDANFTPHGNVIVAFYTNPGAILKISPQGKILWRYEPLSGPGKLNHPSLAVELPNGMVLANDDYNDRVIVINPKTNQIVWQYGHTGIPGSAPGYLNDPDGVDFLPAGITPGTHHSISQHLWSYPGNGY